MISRYSLNLCITIILIIVIPIVAAAISDKNDAASMAKVDNTIDTINTINTINTIDTVDTVDTVGIAGRARPWQHESPTTPVTITDNTLDSAIKNYSSFVLDCWKEGCEPCRLISPTIDEMAQDFKGKVVFGKLLTDQNHKTRVKYHIYHYPMLLIFKNGSLAYKHLGNYPKDTLESIILSKLGIS